MPFGGFGFGQGYFGQSYLFGAEPNAAPKGRVVTLQANTAAFTLLANVDATPGELRASTVHDDYLAGEGED